MKTLWLILIGLMLVAALAVGAISLMSGRPRGNNTVVLGIMGKTGPDAMLYSYGVEKGIFEKHGLTVTYSPCGDSYTKMISLLTGSVDSVATSPGIAASAYCEGENFSIGMAMGLASNLKLIVKPGYDLESIRGKRFGVVGTNSDAYRITKSYLEGKGLDLETDVDLVEISSPANLYTSFETGQLEAAVLQAGFAVEAMNSGGVVLTTITDAAEEVFGHPAYSTTVLLGEKFMEREKIVNAYLRALREIKSEIMKDPEEAIRIHAAFAGETTEKMEALFGITTLVCDIDGEIEGDITAFTDYGLAHGYFGKTFGEEVFYDNWN